MAGIPLVFEQCCHDSKHECNPSELLPSIQVFERGNLKLYCMLRHHIISTVKYFVLFLFVSIIFEIKGI